MSADIVLLPDALKHYRFCKALWDLENIALTQGKRWWYGGGHPRISQKSSFARAAKHYNHAAELAEEVARRLRHGAAELRANVSSAR